MLFHRNLEVVDKSAVREALESGQAENLNIRMRPQDDELIQVWIGVPDSEIQPVPEYRPWGLTGFAMSLGPEPLPPVT